jgi:hypothetical protein
LKAGNFYCYYGVEIIDLGRRGRSVWVKCRDAANIRFVGKAGQTILETRGDSAEIVFLDDERYDYIRVECYGDHGRKSWTQPFFRD